MYVFVIDKLLYHSYKRIMYFYIKFSLVRETLGKFLFLKEMLKPIKKILIELAFVTFFKI